jgi:CRP/FNR family transcriptional regulator, nitrogen fixation regulation protein
MCDDVQTRVWRGNSVDHGQLDMMIPSGGGLSAVAVEPPNNSETSDLGIDGNGYRGDLRATGRARRFLRNREIYSEGDDADCVFKVESGVVRTYKFLRDGRRQINAFHGPGCVFGLEIGKVYGLSAAAASDCDVISYGRRTLEARAALNDQLSLQLFSSVLFSLARAQEHTVSLGRRSAVEKLAIFLVGYCEYSIGGKDIMLEMSRKDIADYLGLTIETVSRTFADLEHRAFIELSGARHVRLMNISALRDLCA